MILSIENTMSVWIRASITVLFFLLLVNITPHHALAATSGIRVSGNRLINDQGQQIVLHGVNISGTEFNCIQSGGIFSGPGDQGLQGMLRWKINAVRIPTNEDCWLGINGANPGGITYQQALSTYVSLLNQNGIYAIIDLQWAAPGTTKATTIINMPDQDHAPAFWTSVANTFKNNTSVLFDLYNEPHGNITWQCWRDGGSSCSLSYQVAGMQTLVTTIRNTGAKNVIMAGGLAYASDPSQWLQFKPTDSANNLAASLHLYNFNGCSNACYNQKAGPVAAQVPLVAGEIGENDCSHGFIDPLMTWLDQHNGSYLGWAWYISGCGSYPSLISDFNGTPTNFGIGLKNHIAVLSNNTPTPNTSPTPIPTQPTATTNPTPTLVPNTTNLGVTIGLHGIGKGGDNVTAHSMGTTVPKHPSRPITVTFFDTLNTQQAQITGQIIFDSSSGLFTGTLPLGTLSTGDYQVKIRVTGFLIRQLPVIVHITANQTTQLPMFSLVNGDIDEENQLNILDYNLLTNCFGSKQTTSSCTKPPSSQATGPVGADIDDNGTVDGADYNLFLRELSTQQGAM